MGNSQGKESNSMQTQGAHNRGQSQPDHRALQELSPPVDIREDAEGITLYADMPGVSRERLNVQLDGNSLLIEGALQIDLPGDTQSVHADIRAVMYRRTFTLSQELEGGNVEANLKDGVLTLRIPKRAEVRPRRIEVSAG